MAIVVRVVFAVVVDGEAVAVLVIALLIVAEIVVEVAVVVVCFDC